MKHCYIIGVYGVKFYDFVAELFKSLRSK